MPRRARTRRQPIQVESLSHPDDSRTNIPSAEMEQVMDDADRLPIHVAYERRNRDLDPQLVWSGKDEQDARDLIAPAPPLFIQEKVHPKVLVDDLMRYSSDNERRDEYQVDLFADFNGLPSDDAKTEFYKHDANWSNRMILGDSLQVMASLAEREGLRGKVQCIYVDPPYGIRFNSNFQWSTTSRDVRDGNVAHITREPEQVRAFRDTWRDGIHSYLSYLRDRLTVARDLLADSGSIFVQIGDENVHRVRAVMDEVFGDGNFISQIEFAKTTGFSGRHLSNVTDHILWFAKNMSHLKYRELSREKRLGEPGATAYRTLAELPGDFRQFEPTRLATSDQLTSQGASASSPQAFNYRGRILDPPAGLHWKTTVLGLERLERCGRVFLVGNTLRYLRFLDDFPVVPFNNNWTDTGIAGYTADRIYVVQTLPKVVERCILMTTDPGDLVVDPTCGAGTTVYVAEQWGRRWITIDTSRVALALARARVMGARYPYYLLSDSPEGQAKQAEIERRASPESPTYGDVRQGFVYERVPHIMLRDISNNAEIDVIWEEAQEELEPLRELLNQKLGESWEEWEIPRDADDEWSPEATALHSAWWNRRIARQKEIDASIAAKADFEYLYDKPYEARRKVRVAGPFTVESLSPHRVLVSGDVKSEVDETGVGYRYDGEVPERDFAALILDNLRTSGVQQSQKSDKIDFTSITGWPGSYICAEGRYMEDDSERRAGIFIGPEFGTVSRADLVAAAREAGDAGYDSLIACAFSYEGQTSGLNRLGRLRILKARMNADLHMADSLRNDSKGNLFVIFGEPDIEIQDAGEDMLRVKIHGVDIYHPATGQVRSDDTDGIACWFVDTDYNEESFFVRHAYFLGAGDPYKALKTSLKAEINAEAWATLYGDTSRPFPRPASGRVAVKVINHLGDEAMKVIAV